VKAPVTQEAIPDARGSAGRGAPGPAVRDCCPQLPVAPGSHKPQAASLLDVSGREVLDLKVGANDLRALAPGVYFVRGEGRGAGDVGPIRKVVLTR
jgi:hypothetical protein